MIYAMLTQWIFLFFYEQERRRHTFVKYESTNRNTLKHTQLVHSHKNLYEKLHVSY